MGGAADRPVAKHSISIRGHRTSFSLEKPFMRELRRIALERRMPLAGLVAEIDSARAPESGLSSALRVYVLEYIKKEPGSAGGH